MRKVFNILLFTIISNFIIISNAFCILGPIAPLNILTLDKAIDIALKRNNNMAIAISEVNKAKALLTQAKSKLLPNLSINATYTHQSKLASFNIGGTDVPIGQNNTYGSQLELKQPLFVGGKIIHGIQASNLYLEISKIGLESQKREIIFNTTKSFHDCLFSKELVEINQETVTRLEEYYKSVKIRYEKGLMPDLEVLRAEAELENAKPNLTEAKNNLILSIKKLKQVLNINEDFKIGGKFQYIPCIVENKDILKEKTINYYPPLNQLRKKINISKKQISIAKGGYLPALYLSSSYVLKQSSGSFGSPEGSLNTTMLLGFPLFKGFQTIGEVREAKASHDQSQKEYQETLLLILLQFEDTWNKFTESKKIIKAQDLNVKKAEKMYQIIIQRYNYGLNSNLDLIDTHLALKQAKVLQAQFMYNYIISKANLENLTGTKFQLITSREK